ncbi:DUF4304 domain-containing protein [Flammeovirga sp. EKP202]|uniref:DUF4304 domain-containing protein n=1 Tax=Flammeovirga sp. EKP202 TaxID=2770592 RepID=UPI00165F8AAA|nr:DUF4304 domain-containing protein [Flammeovirga sp. EKP202]MBD0405329.1 DUF4304 domain-containing protein [Flammeovirga sp. EKP202]
MNTINCFDQKLIKHSFRKKRGNYWVLELDGGFIIINLQRSRFNNKVYFINIGGKSKQISNSIGKLHQEYWHFRGRYGSLIGETELLSELINEEDCNTGYIDDLVCKINSIVVPYISQYFDITFFKKEINEGNYDFLRLLTSVDY